jgi:hypothetical protein
MTLASTPEEPAVVEALPEKDVNAQIVVEFWLVIIAEATTIRTMITATIKTRRAIRGLK